ncbi:MAG: ZIP family metal transporter [Candidatus Latescibacterota bacterium]|nr:MAG: ZIP family metal transporter [Candidatus Latescibacterota bacterium]
MAQRYAEFAMWTFVTSFLGGLIPLLRRWSDAQLKILISLSAGIILGVVFLDLLPQAMDISKHFFTAVLGGFLLLLALEKFLLIHPHETEELAGRRTGLAAYIGISLHSLLDGVALGSSVMVPTLGPAVLWAIVAHKIPNTFSLTSILIYFGFSRRSVLLLLFMFSLVTPLGGALALLLLRNASQEILGLAVGVAAGTFLFIATSDLLPHAHSHHEGRHWNLLAVVAGALLGLLSHATHAH